MFLFLGSNANAQTYPPSCVITAPHSNSYFKENTDVVINVYSTDSGKSSNNGTVSSVDVYVDGQKEGTAVLSSGNTYSFTWGCVAAGSYRITAVATNSAGVSFTSAGVLITVGAAEVTPHGISSCKGKYLANIIANSAHSDYLGYWNGVSAENSCKWGSVEAQRDKMNWGGADYSYKYAADNNLMFRYHAIAWGSQYPDWIVDLSNDVPAFRDEVEEYMAEIAKRYTYIDQIDVLNENMYLNTWDGNEHAGGTPYFRKGLGGPGTTGYDWVIWLFEKAREYFPDSKLVMNDYELENNPEGIDEMLEVVKVLRDRGLIDGFGTQAHCFNVDALQNSPSALDDNLTQMAESGVPVYVTELDLNGGNTVSEKEQLESYTNLFPVYWNHPAVGGVTLWGYVEGATWKEGTGLLNGDRSERSAMKWLKDYVANLDDVGYPYCSVMGCSLSTTDPVVRITSPNALSDFTAPAEILIEAEASDPDGNVSLVEFYVDGVKVGEDASSPYSYTAEDISAGSHILTAVVTDNDGNAITSSKVTLTVGGPKLNGEITVRATGFVGDEIMELEVDGVVVETWTLSTTMDDYTAIANVNGLIRVNYTNDDGADRDAQVDYIIVAGKTYEAEDQEVNTGYYANGECGGGSHNEMMHCSGYIEFATDPVGDIVDNCPNDPNKTEPGECGCGVEEGTCSSDDVILLIPGWNLIGCPIEGSTAIESALSSIWENVELVKDFDKFYDVNAPDFSLLKELEWGNGYLVKVSASCKLDWIAR